MYARQSPNDTETTVCNHSHADCHFRYQRGMPTFTASNVTDSGGVLLLVESARQQPPPPLTPPPLRRFLLPNSHPHLADVT